MQPTDDDPGNPSVDFKGQQRSNATHQSTTDPKARLYKKATGQAAQLCHGLQVLMENRHGRCAGLLVTPACGTAEVEGARALLAHQMDTAARPPRTVGADKGSHQKDFITFCRSQGIAPHVAERSDRQVPGLDGRTTRTASYQVSQRIRKRVEECIGWLVGSAYNLVRMGRLATAPPG